MRTLRALWSTLIVVACVTSAHVAAADDDAHVWDRTYKPQGEGSFPCPQPHQNVVVRDGRFSIAWDLHIGNEFVTIAHIEGTVSASGLTDNVTTHFEKFSRKVMQALAGDSDNPAELRKRQPKVSFSGGRRHGNRDRSVVVAVDEGSCTSEWTWSADDAADGAASGTVDCNSGPYAVALWSKTRAYSTGEFARVATPGQPTRLFRCIDACKAGEDPLSAKDREAAWALFGECAGGASPAVPLASAGSPKWDTTYSSVSGGSQDWRCVRDIKTIVVSKGTFSIPWLLRASGGDRRGDDDDATLSVGKIDGVIAADGSVTTQVTFTISSVPREVLEASGVRKSGGAAMTMLRAWAPTIAMKFVLDVRKTKYDLKGRSASLTLGGPNDCEVQLHGADFDYGERRDEVSCDPGSVWDSKRDYKRYEDVIMKVKGVMTRYSCSDSNGCPAGSRPTEATEWQRVGHCG